MHGDASHSRDGVPARASLVACGPAMLEVLRLVTCYARARTPVILVGETGTGKGLIARELHRASGRTGSFEVLTATELRGTLGGDVLFGHDRGAFTGAAARRKGLLAHAAQGTLLIDDFHHLRASQQIKLLRVLEEGRWRPQGVDREVPVECRIVVTLPRDPDTMVRQRVLLPDIRFRLGYAVIAVPRLAERREDIPLLAAHFLHQAPEETGISSGPAEFGEGVCSLLQRAAWPGNVRELQGVVRTAYLHAGDASAAELEHLPASALGPLRYAKHGTASHNRRAIALALTLARGDVPRAARLTGASRATIYRTAPLLEGRQTEFVSRAVLKIGRETKVAASGT